MKWVTWTNIGVDRMACIWLIRRWIDSKAEFFFIPNGETPSSKDYEPFDIPGTHYSHHGGHCTFHTFLREHNLNDPALRRIARMVDEADAIQEVRVEPAATGLDLICRGLRQISKDDLEAMEHGCLIYEALYAELSREEA